MNQKVFIDLPDLILVSFQKVFAVWTKQRQEKKRSQTDRGPYIVDRRRRGTLRAMVLQGETDLGTD